jgi:hypothetical protein
LVLAAPAVRLSTISHLRRLACTGGARWRAVRRPSCCLQPTLARPYHPPPPPFIGPLHTALGWVHTNCMRMHQRTKIRFLIDYLLCPCSHTYCSRVCSAAPYTHARPFRACFYPVFQHTVRPARVLPTPSVWGGRSCDRMPLQSVLLLLSALNVLQALSVWEVSLYCMQGTCYSLICAVGRCVVVCHSVGHVLRNRLCLLLLTGLRNGQIGLVLSFFVGAVLYGVVGAWHCLSSHALAGRSVDRRLSLVSELQCCKAVRAFSARALHRYHH